MIEIHQVLFQLSLQLICRQSSFVFFHTDDDYDDIKKFRIDSLSYFFSIQYHHNNKINIYEIYYNTEIFFV